MEASKIEGDVWTYKRYFFYTVAETAITSGVLYTSGKRKALGAPMLTS